MFARLIGARKVRLTLFQYGHTSRYGNRGAVSAGPASSRVALPRQRRSVGGHRQIGSSRRDKCLFGQQFSVNRARFNDSLSSTTSHGHAMSCQKFLRDCSGPRGEFYDCAAGAPASHHFAPLDNMRVANSHHGEINLSRALAGASGGTAVAGPA